MTHGREDLWVAAIILAIFAVGAWGSWELSRQVPTIEKAVSHRVFSR